MKHDLHLTEDTLDSLVSIAILRAQFLDNEMDPAAPQAWREVMHYERDLATLCPASSLAGGIARAGAISAALAAKEEHEAYQLKTLYFADADLPQERRARIQQLLATHEQTKAIRYPHLATAGLIKLLQEVNQQLRATANQPTRIFPCYAGQ